MSIFKQLQNDLRLFQSTLPTGPISKITTIQLKSENFWQASAWIHPDLLHSLAPHSLLYSSAPGCGTDASRIHSIRKAIFEAMERWAFVECMSSPDSSRKSQLALDWSTSTHGMAARGVSDLKACRQHALCEALERHVLLNAWRGSISLQRDFRTQDTFGAQIYFDSHTYYFALIQNTYAPGRYAFGFSCRANETEALAHAKIELLRNVEALRISSGESSDQLRDLYEKRAYFFSTQTGYDLFRDRIAARSTSKVQSITLRSPILCDRAVPGPWSRYCRVHRIVLDETPDIRELIRSGSREIFLF